MASSSKGVPVSALGVLPVHSGYALEALRNSSFDTTSAIGEIIDNSIQAEAKNIRIELRVEQVNEGRRGRPKFRITRVAVGDDGIGMDSATLQRCLQLGFSSRFNDRDGIGRFGVGMTLGAINQCRQVEVYAHEGGNAWLWTMLDLDEVRRAGESATIPPPVQKNPSTDEQKLVEAERGTIVIWDKIDRMYDNEVEDIKHWISRTYRKFLADKLLSEPRAGGVPELIGNPKRVHIFVNGEELAAFDPLYFQPTIPNDPPSELGESIVFDWPHEDSTIDTKKHGIHGKVTIRFALLPTKLRPQRMWGDSRDALARHIPDNVGISILRNGREVYYGPWNPILELGSESAGRQLDRYWGAEVEFPPTLDKNFQVRNIKVGAKPLAPLAEKLEEVMRPTIDGYRKDIQKFWDQVDAEKLKKAPEPARKHVEAEKIADEVAPPVKPAPTSPEKKKEIIRSLVPELEGKSEKEIGEWIDALGRFGIIEAATADPRGPFIDITPMGAKTILHYTMRHPFFLEVFEHLNRVEELAKDVKDPVSTELAQHARDLKLVLDLLLMSYANSRNLLIGEGKGQETYVLQRLMDYWSSTLREFVERRKANNVKGD